jgi:hypothetical protein
MRHRPATVALSEPPLPKGRDFDGHHFVGLHYRPYEGDLFVGRVSGADIGQGDLGDCFFLSSLVAVANTHPTVIRRAIAAHGDGTYTVTFWERIRGVPRPLRIRVDRQFPTDGRGRQKFGRGLRAGPHGQELWPALFEKAYAVSQRGYVHTNQGGDGRAALTALTGMPSRALVPSNLTRASLWERLVQGVKARHPMVTSTPTTRDLERRTGRRDLAGLLDDHYYAVVNVAQRRGERLVKLYSPLVDLSAAAVSTPEARDDAHRHVVLTLDEYRRDFDQLATSALGRATRAATRR